MNSDQEKLKKLNQAAKNIRKNIIEVGYKCAAKNGCHFGSSLSIVEILTVIYKHFLKPEDKFILSKNHGALALYCALYESGIITKEDLYKFEQNGSYFASHTTKNEDLGIIYSGGSLGMGLSYGCGLALSNKLQNKKGNIYIVVGDGEIQEGNCFEAFSFIKANNLNNIVCIVDSNDMQSDGKTINNISKEVFTELGFYSDYCLGHNIEDLIEVLNTWLFRNDPAVLLAKTIKGKGVSFMENNNDWHHNVLTEKLYKEALSCLGEEC